MSQERRNILVAFRRKSILFVVVLLAVAVIAEARPQAKVSKIGWLSARSRFNQRLENLLELQKD